MNRRNFIISLLAVATVGLEEPAEARRRKSGRRRSRSSRALRGHSGSIGSRGISDSGSCPCNGGDVCVGPRGGRYCITSGGNKRYGV